MAKTADLESLLQTLADGTRLRLLALLSQGEICVCFFVEAMGEPQPKISRHLGHLRSAGLVNTRRDGKWIHYALARPQAPELARVFDSILESVESLPEVQRDRRRLSAACCKVRPSETIARAPKPVFAVEA